MQIFVTGRLTGRMKILLSAAGILLLAALVLTGYLIGRAVHGAADTPMNPAFPEKIGSIPVYTDLLPQGSLNRPGEIRTVKYIVIHETANENADADAKAHNTYIHNIANEQELSWHYTVDDRQIYHHLPDNEVGWHAASREGNQYGIGIEVCVNKGGNFDKAFDNAAALAAYLMYTYKLDADALMQHHDFYDKDCPHYIRSEGRWEEFIALVKQKYAALKKDGV